MVISPDRFPTFTPVAWENLHTPVCPPLTHIVVTPPSPFRSLPIQLPHHSAPGNPKYLWNVWESMDERVSRRNIECSRVSG